MPVKKTAFAIFKKIIHILLWLAGFCLVLLAIRGFVQPLIRQATASTDAICETEKVTLGGVDQQIFVEARDADAPILIMLHGGPQSPLLFGEGYRGFYPELTSHFITVFWDQYGSGANGSADATNVRLSDQITMLCDLITALHQTYPNRPLYLFGYSNGSILSVEAAMRVPDQIQGIVNFEQVTSSADAKANAAAILTSEQPELFSPSSTAGALASEDYHSLTAFETQITLRTNSLLDWENPLDDLRMISAFLYVLLSPDYSLRDLFWAYYGNLSGDSSFPALREDLYEVDALPALKAIQVPTTIIQTRSDIYATPEDMAEIAQANPAITYIPADGAHLPTNGDFELIEDTLIKLSTASSVPGS